MFSLSTSWNYKDCTSGYDLTKQVKVIGFDSVELNFALTESIVREVLELVRSGLIKVSSVHNMCPLPKEIDPSKASPDYYSLSSTDGDERMLAIQAAKNTISWAKKLGARAVVLHCGRVQIRDRTRDLAALPMGSGGFELLKQDMVREREEKARPYFDNTVNSLSELVPFAEDNGVLLGVENRYYYREIPILPELEDIFNKFSSPNIGYWHDVGHAEVFERLGLCKHKDLLDKFSARLIGMHLHDIIGNIKDHNPPGLGAFNFKFLKPYIKSDTIKVIEAHQPATGQEIGKSAQYLTNILG